MVFSSIFFLLFFLPIFLVVYNLLPKKWKNAWILIASIFFYWWGAPLFIGVVLLSTLIDFQIVKALYHAKDVVRRRRLLVLSVALNLGLLAYFKYANFFVENFNAILHYYGASTIGWTSVALPIGISFFIFQSITYAVDVYRGVNPPVKSFSTYLLYILSFPQMIAGPIIKFKDIAHQLSERKETVDDKLLGFYRFCIGLGKKVLIANVLAVQADLILNEDLNSLSTVSAWVGILAYTFQIYFDFSGYSDMAIGLGRMIGFKFPENFNSPYLSKNISEFWRRWHMTLGSFMREYLYIPLGGNRVNKRRLYINLVITFTLSGLWHGASWNFVIWGMYHGLFLILDRLFLIKLLTRLGNVFSTIITFLIVVVGWSIFRMEDTNQMWMLLQRMFTFNSGNFVQISLESKVIFIVAIIFSLINVTKLGRRCENIMFFSESVALKYHFVFAIISGCLFALSVGSIAATNFNPFIYFRF